MDRRRFLKAAGGTALALTAGVPASGRQKPSQPDEAVVGQADERIRKCRTGMAALRFLGPDGQPLPAGLVRDDMTSKPAYEQLLGLVKGRWWTKAEAVTGAQGDLDFQGFLGQYEIEAKLGGRKLTGGFALDKDRKATVEIRLV
jgi:hypothetical protein